ncbi:unnamed protein product [Meloidogyne enterolobii]|uniref:Uncharacterized protein n=1 Tax=Meloidogyne enterolobii TaxID=390850 RepID=A0ACB0YGB5_MELEN
MSQRGSSNRGSSEPRGQTYQYGGSTSRLSQKRQNTSDENVYCTCATNEDALLNIHLNGRHSLSVQFGEDEEGKLLIHLNGQQIFLGEDEWKRTDSLCSPMAYIEEAERCMEEDPSNEIRASDKCWASLGATVALFYKDLSVVVQDGSSNKTLHGLNLKTHKAMITMARFAANFSSKRASLGGVIESVKYARFNDHRETLDTYEIWKIIERMKFFIEEFGEIDKKEVEKELAPLINSGKYKKVIFLKETKSDLICGTRYNFDIQVEYVKKNEKILSPKL